MTKVAVFFADGFEEIEAIAIVDVLRRAEIEVLMTGVGATQIKGAHGISVAMDTAIEDINVDELDALVLPGGLPGAENLKNSETLIAMLKEAAGQGKITAAICAAPMALAAAGLVAGKKVTCYPGFESHLEAADYSAARVEEDGLIITGRGPGTAIEFALKLVERLGQPETASALEKGMIVA